MSFDSGIHMPSDSASNLSFDSDVFSDVSLSCSLSTSACSPIPSPSTTPLPLSTIHIGELSSPCSTLFSPLAEPFTPSIGSSSGSPEEEPYTNFVANLYRLASFVSPNDPQQQQQQTQQHFGQHVQFSHQQQKHQKNHKYQKFQKQPSSHFNHHHHQQFTHHHQPHSHYSHHHHHPHHHHEQQQQQSQQQQPLSTGPPQRPAFLPLMPQASFGQPIASTPINSSPDSNLTSVDEMWSFGTCSSSDSDASNVNLNSSTDSNAPVAGGCGGGVPRKPCSLCVSNNEPLAVSSGHSLRDPVTQLVTCPVLRKYVCPLCKATGDYAHTRSYCPIARAGRRLFGGNPHLGHYFHNSGVLTRNHHGSYANHHKHCSS